MRVAAYTLGCKVNSYETSAVLQMFKQKNYEIVNFNEQADVYIVNTCSVTNQSDVKSRKALRSAIGHNPDAVVVAMGCYSQLNAQAVLNIPGVDLVVGTSQRKEIPTLVEEIMEKRKPVNMVIDSQKIHDFECLEATEFEHTRAFLKIQDGCNNFCSYCIIPYARGRMRSRPVKDVLDECIKITEKGYKEIVLAGIHTGGYGQDINYPFSRLIKDILDSTPKLERLRISSIEINQIDDDILKMMRDDKRLCKHLHLPIQSGSNQVLKDMHRHYDVEAYLQMLKKIRSYVPDIAITTDLIIGFPTEDDKSFSETLETVKKCQFAFIHIFPFSKRNGTVAASYPELNGTIVKNRFKLLNEINLRMANDYAQKFLNCQLDFIPESYENGHVVGHTSNFLKVECPGSIDLIGKKRQIIVEKCGFPQNKGKII